MTTDGPGDGAADVVGANVNSATVGTSLGLRDMLGCGVADVGSDDCDGLSEGAEELVGVGPVTVGASDGNEEIVKLGCEVAEGAGVNSNGSSMTEPLAAMLSRRPCSLRSWTTAK